MDLGAAVVADEQSFEVVEPGEGAFDHPAGLAEPGAVLGIAPRDLGSDAAAAEFAPLRPMVVATVGQQPGGPASGCAGLAAHSRDGVHERQELGYVVAVAAAERPGKRDAVAVDEEVVLRPRFGSINRARARLGAPFFAGT